MLKLYLEVENFKMIIIDSLVDGACPYILKAGL